MNTERSCPGAGLAAPAPRRLAIPRSERVCETRPVRTPVALAAPLLASLAACGGPASTADSGVAPDAISLGDASPIEPPPGVQLRAHAVNIVNASAAAEVRDYVLSDTPELYASIAAFYEHFDDEYDFVYVFPGEPLDMPEAAARYTAVRHPAIPSIGLASAYENPMYGDHPRLRGAIGVDFNTIGNGPMLHETLHHWGVFLDERFGFGRDRDTFFGAHWGVAGVNGQHGGFDTLTVQCGTPAGASPPCSPDPDGTIRLSTAPFGPAANGGDGVPFAPIELYLMGLLPRAEVPSPILVLDGAHFVRQDPATERFEFEITGTHDVSLDDIVAVHGERPAAGPEDRAFRAAFVCFSDAPLSSARMDALERWAAIFGDDLSQPGLFSFASGTGGRATMSTRLGPIH